MTALASARRMIPSELRLPAKPSESDRTGFGDSAFVGGSPMACVALVISADCSASSATSSERNDDVDYKSLVRQDETLDFLQAR